MEIYNEEQVKEVKKAKIVDSKAMNLFKVYFIFAFAILITGAMMIAWPYIIVGIYGNAGDEAFNAYVISLCVFLVIMLISSIGQMITSFSNKSVLIGIFFALYAISFGGFASSLTLMFELQDIYISFLITGGLFLLMGAVGMLLKDKTSKLVMMSTTFMLGILILCLVNFFLNSSLIYWIVSICVFAFYLLYAAFDIYRVDRLASSKAFTSSNALCLYEAYCLYSDFIIIFLYVLRFISALKKD